MKKADRRAQQAAVAQAIQTQLFPDEHPGSLLTNWVVVAEFVAPDGEPYLIRADSENMTVWLRAGMLQDALDNFDWSKEEYEDEDG